MSSLRRERGAAAVEFALILPVFLLLVFGMIEFSRAYNAQISLSGAAREGAREMAVHNNAAAAVAAASQAAPSLSPKISASQVSISPSTCTGRLGQPVQVTISYNFPLMTGFFGVSIPLTGVGVMQCGG